MTSSSVDYFDSIGGEWDRMRGAFFPESVRDRALEEVHIEPGSRVADVGAGTGFVTEALVERGARVVAIDRSTAMLAALRKKFPQTEMVDRRVGEAERLPLPDAAVSHVFANMALHHVEAPADAIGEMVRILRPGGRLVVTDLDAHGHEFLRLEHHDRWLGFDRQQIDRWFRRAGLIDVQVGSLGEVCYSTSCDGEEAAIGIFIASGARSAAT